MPAFNAEKDIAKAVKSITDQTYGDFTLVVVNDGSTDKTADVLDEFACDNRIKILYQENTGIAGAYRNAFQHLDGDYIMFLDSDDCYDANTLFDINQEINKSHADIVQFGISYFNESWNHIRDLTFEAKEINTNLEIISNYFNGINNGSDRPNLGIRAYKKSLFDGFNFPPIGSLGIDEILNLYAITKCNHITYLEKPYYLCQQRSNSVSRIKPSIKKVEGIIASYNEMENIVSKECASFEDLLYVKFLKFYISHLNLIKKLPDFKEIKELNKKRFIVLNKSKRVNIKFSIKARMFLLVHFPCLSFILSKF